MIANRAAVGRERSNYRSAGRVDLQVWKCDQSTRQICCVTGSVTDRRAVRQVHRGNRERRNSAIVGSNRVDEGQCIGTGSAGISCRSTAIQCQCRCARDRYYLVQIECHDDRVARKLNTRRRYCGRLIHHRRIRIDGDAERLEAALVLPATSVAVARQAVGAVGERGRRIGPVAAAIGGGAAEQGGAVIDLDRGIGFGAAGERQGIVIGDAIARRAAVGRVRGNRRGDRGTGVDGDAERTRGRAGIAGHIGGGGGQAVGAVGERGRRIGPVAAAIGGGAAEQRGAVIDLDRGIGFRAAGERQGIVIGDAIANRAAVGRVRGNRRGDRGTGVDGDAERTRGRAGIAGDIGGGGASGCGRRW